MKSTTSSPDLSLVSSTSSSSGCHVTQKALELTVSKSQTLSAEIWWALQSILKGHSNNSSNNISPLFKVMFPDSKTVERFVLGADKLRYLTTYGIAPYFCDLLKDKATCIWKFIQCHFIASNLYTGCSGYLDEIYKILVDTLDLKAGFPLANFFIQSDQKQ